MDNMKLFVKALLAGMAAFMLWLMIAPRFFPAPPQSQPATDADQAASQPAPTSMPTSAPAAIAAAASRPASKPKPTPIKDSQIKRLDLGHAVADGDFRMELRCSNRGASVERILLSDFAQVINEDQRYELLLPIQDPQTGTTFNSLAVERVQFVEQKQAVDLAEVPWTGRKTSTPEAEEAIFTTTVPLNGNDALEITRVYRLPKRAVKALKHNSPERLRHDLTITTSVRNLSTDTQKVVLVTRGPVGLRQEESRGDKRLALAALGRIEEAQFKKKTRKNAAKGDGFAVELTSPDENEKFLYATLTNKFFTTIFYPNSVSDNPGDFLYKVEAVDVLGDQELDTNDAHNRSDLTLRFTTRPITLQPGASRTTAFDCFFGPKSKTAFQKLSPYKERRYVDMLVAEYLWCAWGPLTNLMIDFFQLIHSVPPHNYGLAIIALVAIVRFLLHPITKMGQKNMMRMQTQMVSLQPRLEEAKKKYANDKAKLNQATMEVYREANVSPAGQMLGCLPMFLQMPVWGALWTALSFTVEMRHQGFVLWITDLTAPDALIHFPSPVNIPLISLMTGPIHSLNILPLLLGLSMYLQQRFMPKPAAKQRAKRQTSEQMQQQKIMMYMMTVLFSLMFYNAPSGLTLYIMSSTTAGLVEQWRIRKHLKEEEEQGPKPKKSRAWKKPMFLKKLELLAERAKQEPQRSNKRRPPSK